jgi:hypothetical protein
VIIFSICLKGDRGRRIGQKKEKEKRNTAFAKECRPKAEGVFCNDEDRKREKD